MSIDWDKPIQTRSGCEVRIFTTSGGDPEKPVVGERLDDMGDWVLFKRRESGQVWAGDSNDSYDLVNVPQQHTATINVNRRNGQHQMYLCIHASREEADDQAPGHRIACIEVTFTEGEGLCEPLKSASLN